MTWSLSHISQILHWAESGHINTPQLRAIEQLGRLQPQRVTWLTAGQWFCTTAGTVLLAAGVIFFFAYNWAALHRFAKLGLAAAALSACVVAAWASRPASTVWQWALLGAALCTGALLALIGQTYQTGADIWELFIAWLALMLPFALLARAWPNWLLCMVVMNLGLIRFLSMGGLWQWGLGEAAQPALLIVANSLWWLLAGLWARGLLTEPSRHLERTAALLTLLPLSWGAALGMFGLSSQHANGYGAYLPVFAIAEAALLLCYRHWRLDIFMLGILSACAVFVGGSLLLRGLLEGGDLVSGLIVMAIYVMGVSGALLGWLRKLIRQQHAPPDAARPSDASPKPEPQP